jgi:hypothetical protein
VLDLKTLRLLHPHGDDLVPLETSEGSPHHDPAAHDIERGEGWWRRVMRCTTCNEVVVLEGQLIGDVPEGRA